MNGNTQLARQDQATTIEQVLIGGDLKALQPADRVAYYNRVCESLNLNPLTKPFEYIVLNGKMVLYARKDATEQLRKRDKVSVTIVAREVVEDVYVVTARATLPDGRCDESIGAVSIAKLAGEAKANALMKAETKAKRRVTLSICGLGMLDETEVETIPGAIYPQQEAPAPVVERPRPAIPQPEPAPVTCADCDALMEDVEWADGTRWTAQEMIDYTLEHHERTLCLPCFAKEKGWEEA